MTPDKARTCFHYEKEMHLFDTTNKSCHGIRKRSEFLKGHVNKNKLDHCSRDVVAVNINSVTQYFSL